MISCHFCEVEIQMHATLKSCGVVLLPKKTPSALSLLYYCLPSCVSYCVVSKSYSLLVTSKHSVVVEDTHPVLDVRQKNVKSFAQSHAVNL